MTATLSFDQIAEAFGKDECGSAHLYYLDLTARDKQIKTAATEAREPAGVRNAHTNRFDRQGR